MRTHPRALILTLLLYAAVSIGACGSDDAVRPVNKDPVMHSLIAFPTAIGPGDSLIVICIATDPDSDSLFYDWSTDSRLVIKGQDPADHELFNSRFNSQIFYHGVVSPFDTAWVECIAHDRKGGNAVREVGVLVNQ